mgnify:FL=1
MIYFDGCSVTMGAELDDKETKRYSRLVANHFGVEDYNIAVGGGSNRRILRNLLSHDLSQYEMFIIQMTKRMRTEFYNDGWQRIQTSVPHPFLKDMYTDEYGKIDEMIMYHAIKSILKDRPHFILSIQHDTKVPVDYVTNDPYPRAPRGHPNEEGHKFLANLVISRVDNT